MQPAEPWPPPLATEAEFESWRAGAVSCLTRRNPGGNTAQAAWLPPSLGPSASLHALPQGTLCLPQTDVSVVRKPDTGQSPLDTASSPQEVTSIHFFVPPRWLPPSLDLETIVPLESRNLFYSFSADTSPSLLSSVHEAGPESCP